MSASAPATRHTEPKSVVTRYDTQGSFSATTSWSAFDAAQLGSAARGFFGAVFDGRWITFVPQSHAVATDGGPEETLAVRYDTQADFSATSSWSTFDTNVLTPGMESFTGGVFDGHYVYLIGTLRVDRDSSIDGDGRFVLPGTTSTITCVGFSATGCPKRTGCWSKKVLSSRWKSAPAIST